MIVCLIAAAAIFYITRYNARHSCRAEELRIGMMSGWAPFMNRNEEGKFEGFDVDIAQKIADHLGKKLLIVDAGSLASLFLMLEQGSIDMAMSGLDITHQRKQKYDMIPYYGEAARHFYILHKSDKLRKAATITDSLDGTLTIAAEPASAQSRFLEGFSFIEIKPLESIAHMIMDVNFHKSDGMIVEEGVMKRITKQDPSLEVIKLDLPTEFIVEGMGVALKRGNNQTAQIATIIDELKAAGELQQASVTWGLE